MAIQFVFVRIILLSTNEFACSLPHTVPPARDSPSLFACNAYIPTYFKSRLKPGTENLTSRFIQLRKENGSLFTGRKYSAQAGWEHILQQMRQEFPTIMADVHYRVLKKKWSNLLQQYKELKNPVHGDKNKSDDVSWPFYSAIDQVLGYRHRVEEDDVNPHEFLCLSVTPEEPASPEEQHRHDSDVDEVASRGALQRIRTLNEDCSIEIEKLSRVPIRRQRSASRTSQVAQDLRRREVNDVLVSRLPPATELSIKTIRSTSTVPSVCVRNLSQDRDVPYHFLRDALAVAKRNRNHLDVNDDGNLPQKMRKVEDPQNHDEGHVGCALERRLAEFLEYTKRRDEENREIMTRILTAVEKIAEKR